MKTKTAKNKVKAARKCDRASCQNTTTNESGDCCPECEEKGWNPYLGTEGDRFDVRIYAHMP
jgi:hypothetical protein